MKCTSVSQFIAAFFLMLLLFSCNKKNKKADIKNITPKEMDAYVQESIDEMLSDTDKKTNKADDSTRLYALPVLNFYYKEVSYVPIWSSSKKWKYTADSLLAYLQHCETDGLFKEDYQFALLQNVKNQLDNDSLKRLEPYLWARADILFTDAFVHMIQDLKQGRLQPDSLSWKYKADKQEGFFKTQLDKIKNAQSLAGIVQAVQPSHRDYIILKNNLPAFLDSMDEKKYTYLFYPYKDSVAFIKKLMTRLGESGFAVEPVATLDSTKLKQLLMNFQKAKGLKPTCQLSAAMVNLLNNTGREKFKRIAITLDRYKLLPDTLPEKYIWVNLPSYYLKVWDKDSIVMESKIIIGKPNTPTPDISSEISDLVIYPTWTVPNSIIVKDIIPGMKKNPGYLAKKGLGLYDNKGDPIDPNTVNWAKYTKGIPYFVRQSSGDNNALGVIKFNFSNPYAVYLHDTNQRYLFKNKSRSLSHGCVRVQEWQKLAFYIVKNDSIHSTKPDTLKLTTDSITSWIAQKQKHYVGINTRLPLFIRYFGCEVVNGNLKFYEDVYNKDKALREKYFALK
ncbi:MAG TPA: L,D-transpeptidase family protein [Ferruginibacter sp.]|nr:L,D-transpeptidase family protein [Ferruginibacter sp.]